MEYSDHVSPLRAANPEPGVAAHNIEAESAARSIAWPLGRFVVETLVQLAPSNWNIPAVVDANRFVPNIVRLVIV
jgi:hypothetical protein